MTNAPEPVVCAACRRPLPPGSPGPTCPGPCTFHEQFWASVMRLNDAARERMRANPPRVIKLPLPRFTR